MTMRAASPTAQEKNAVTTAAEEAAENVRENPSVKIISAYRQLSFNSNRK
jgi:hypothetical protein